MIPPLHLIASDRVLSAQGFLHRAEDVMRAGRDRLVLHLRPRTTNARDVLARIDALRPIAAQVGVRLAVNDRVDLALVSDVDWVHLGSRSLSIEGARRSMPARTTIGRSVHHATEAAASSGADYLIAGNVFETASHPGLPAKGTDFVTGVARAARGIPVVAIGGIQPGNVAALGTAGAAGVAVLSGVWSSGAPADAVTRYLEAWTDARGQSPASQEND